MCPALHATGAAAGDPLRAGPRLSPPRRRRTAAELDGYVCSPATSPRKACCCWSTKHRRLADHLLEELRLLTNLSRGGAPRVRLVMAGLAVAGRKAREPRTAIVQSAALGALLPDGAHPSGDGTVYPRPVGRVACRCRSNLRHGRHSMPSSPRPMAFRGS